MGDITSRPPKLPKPAKVIVPKALPKGPGVVRIGKVKGTTLKKGEAGRMEGIRIGDTWVIFRDWDRQRVSYSVIADSQISVMDAVPVTFGEPLVD